MIAAVDYVGLGALISATCAGIVSIVVAVTQRPIARTVTDVRDALQTENGETVASIVEGNDLRYLDPADPPPAP